jgi:hypothetical protein
MSRILPLPKYRVIVQAQHHPLRGYAYVIVRTDLPEWAECSQTKMDRTTMLATRAAVMAPAIVPIPSVIPGRSPLFQRIRPIAVLALGSAASLAWTALLGYGLVTLVRLAL